MPTRSNPAPGPRRPGLSGAAPSTESGAFRPPWWGRNGHVQTIWGPLFRTDRLPLRRERLSTPDGDFVDLDWLDGEEDAAGAPTLLVLHGLEGSSRSHYVSGLLRAGRAAGWHGVAFNFRSCSGELNRLPRFYHSGETGDLAWVVASLVARAPGVTDRRRRRVARRQRPPQVARGGGRRRRRAELRGAVGISVPFDVAACARVLDRGFHRLVYAANFLRTMRSKVIEKERRYPGFVDVAAMRGARTFARYDRVVTAPLNGFRDEVDYWTRASSGPYLARIRRPTLLLGAHDDPIVPGRTLPRRRRISRRTSGPSSPRAAATPGSSRADGPGARRSWAERRAVEFLTSLLRG